MGVIDGYSPKGVETEKDVQTANSSSVKSGINCNFFSLFIS